MQLGITYQDMNEMKVMVDTQAAISMSIIHLLTGGCHGSQRMIDK